MNKGATMNASRSLTVGLFIIMIAALFWTGCGSVSAPPVELPAPITGRVDVSAPDENGDVTVTGTEGAVTGDNVVMVVNEDVAGVVAMRILSALIPSAYAQNGDLPAICSEAGHACTWAAADGSFELKIPASSGDSLAIGLIDQTTGEFISGILHVIVPESGTPQPGANCAGESVSGEVVDIKIAPTDKIPIMLKQGSATTTNQLVIGSSSPTTTSIAGCYAHSLDILYTVLGDMIAVTSKEDKILWAGRIVNGEVRDSRQFTLSDEPMHIAYVNLPTLPIIALKTSDTVKLATVSTTEGNVLEEMQLVHNSQPITGLTRSLRIDVMPMTITFGHYLGLLLTDDGNNANAYMTLFQANGIIHKGSWNLSDINNENPPYTAESIVDGIIYKVELPPFMRIAILDSAGITNNLRRYLVKIDPSKPLPFNADLSVYPSLYTPERELEHNWAAGALAKMALSESLPNDPRAIMADADGTLLEDMLAQDQGVIPISVWALNHDIAAIDINDEANMLFGADATAGVMLDRSADIIW